MIDPAQVPTPRTDAAIVEFEYEYTGYGGESLGSFKEIIDPDFARDIERETIRQKAVIDGLMRALKGLVAEYSTQHGQYGAEHIWRKYEDSTALPSAKEAIAAAEALG